MKLPLVSLVVLSTGCLPCVCPSDVQDDLAECRAELRDAALAGQTDAQALAVYEACKRRHGLTE